MGAQQTATQRNATHGNGAVEEAGGQRGEGSRAGLGWAGWRQEWRVARVQQPRRRKIKPSRHAQHARMAKTWVARVSLGWMQLGGPLTELTFFQFPALLPLLQPGCGVRWAPARQACAHRCVCECCGWAWRRLPCSATHWCLSQHNKTQHSWALLTAHSPPRRYLEEQAAYLHLHGSHTLPEALQGGCDACWTGRGLGRDWLEGGQGRAGQGRHRVPRGT